jgi:hypothetical protein
MAQRLRVGEKVRVGGKVGYVSHTLSLKERLNAMSEVDAPIFLKGLVGRYHGRVEDYQSVLVDFGKRMKWHESREIELLEERREI